MKKNANAVVVQTPKSKNYYQGLNCPGVKSPHPAKHFKTYSEVIFI